MLQTQAPLIVLMHKLIIHFISWMVLVMRCILLHPWWILTGAKPYVYFEQLAKFCLHIVALMIYANLYRVLSLLSWIKYEIRFVVDSWDYILNCHYWTVTGKMVREIHVNGPRDQNFVESWSWDYFFRGKLVLGLLFSWKNGPTVKNLVPSQDQKFRAKLVL